MAEKTKSGKRYWKPFHELTIESVNEIFDTGNDELIRGLVSCVHSFVKESAMRKLLSMCESGEYYPAPAGSCKKVKLSVVGREKECCSLLSGEFSKFLEQGHGHGGDRLK